MKPKSYDFRTTYCSQYMARTGLAHSEWVWPNRHGSRGEGVHRLYNRKHCMSLGRFLGVDWVLPRAPLLLSLVYSSGLRYQHMDRSVGCYIYRVGLYRRYPPTKIWSYLRFDLFSSINSNIVPCEVFLSWRLCSGYQWTPRHQK